MYPELFKIGDFAITSFGLMMFLSFLSAAWITGAQLKRYGMRSDLAWDMLAWVAVGGILGAKLYYLALNMDAVMEAPLRQLFSRGGLVWYGGLIGGVTAYYLQVRKRKLPMATMYDATAPALALAYAVGRMGCFLVGDDYGRYTDSSIGIAFPNGAPPSTAGYLRSNGDFVPAQFADNAIVPVHPTQLYEVGLALLMFALLWQLGKNRNFRVGQLFAVYLCLYAVERFAIEFVRTKSDIISLGGVGVSTSQIMSVVLIVVGSYLWFKQGRDGAPAPLAAGGASAPGKPNRVATRSA